jgi:hypothetical protein
VLEALRRQPDVGNHLVDHLRRSATSSGPTSSAWPGCRRPVPVRAAALSSYATVGGTWIAFVTLVAWFIAARGTWKSRDAGRFLLLLLPLLALLGQLHFAVKFAIDAQGPIKGAYMQFAAAPLCGLFGVAAVWAWKRGWTGKLAVAMHALALATVTAYCCYARLG